MIRTLIYDCEIIRCIPSDQGKFTGYEYCDGWNDHKNMGISVIGTWCSGWGDFSPGLRAFVNTEDMIPWNCPEFQRMAQEAEHIIGFNSIAFDDRLCEANAIKIQTTYDLLCEVRVASGQPPHYVRGETRPGYSLGAIAEANLGHGKSGSGALAPQFWQGGNRDEVIRYCLDDVDITRQLWEQRKTLTDPTTGETLTLA